MQRVERADAARIDALVVAGRADSRYSEEQHGAARAVEAADTLAAHLTSAARALSASAHMVECMRDSHTEEERRRLVERTWLSLAECSEEAISRVQEALPRTDTAATDHATANRAHAGAIRLPPPAPLARE